MVSLTLAAYPRVEALAGEVRCQGVDMCLAAEIKAMSKPSAPNLRAAATPRPRPAPTMAMVVILSFLDGCWSCFWSPTRLSG